MATQSYLLMVMTQLRKFIKSRPMSLRFNVPSAAAWKPGMRPLRENMASPRETPGKSGNALRVPCQVKEEHNAS